MPGRKYFFSIFISFLFLTSATNRALSESLPDRPVLVIPGILGTRLVDEKANQLVWGNAGALRRLARITITNGPRDPLPIDGIRTDGLVQEASVFGLWNVKQYTTLKSALVKLGYRDGRTYFEFPYDWRQSNLTTARKLKEFVNNHSILRHSEFDIIAHSMGGLIAVIFSKMHDQRSQVRKIVFMGTPFRGSANTLATLTEGWGGVKNWLAGGLKTVQKFALSMPSFYELLPRYPNCCRIGVPGDSSSFDLLTSGDWKKISWKVPLGAEAALRNTFVARQKIARIVDMKFPNHVSTYLIAGAGIKTRSQFYVNESTGILTEFADGVGDGTVPEFSAVNFRPGRAFVSLAEHATIFDDESAQSTLRRVLVGSPLPPDRSSVGLRILTSDNQVIELDAIDLRLSASAIPSMSKTMLTVDVHAKGSAPVNKVEVSLTIGGSEEIGPSRLIEKIRAATGSLGRQVIELGPFPKPGPVEIALKIKGGPVFKKYVVVVPREDEGR